MLILLIELIFIYFEFNVYDVVCVRIFLVLRNFFNGIFGFFFEFEFIILCI